MGSPFGAYAIAMDEIEAHNCHQILDCPAGPGAFSKLLLDNGYTPKCADIYPEYFELPELECCHCDMNVTLPFETAQFDAVACLNGLHRVWARARCLSELRRVTKPGGIVIISFPEGGLSGHLKFLGSGTAVASFIGPPATFDPSAADPATSYRIHLSVANVLSIFESLDIEVVSVRSAGLKKIRESGYKKGVLSLLNRLLLLPLALLIKIATLLVPKKTRRRYYMSASNSWSALLGSNIVVTGRVK